MEVRSPQYDAALPTPPSAEAVARYLCCPKETAVARRLLLKWRKADPVFASLVDVPGPHRNAVLEIRTFSAACKVVEHAAVSMRQAKEHKKARIQRFMAAWSEHLFIMTSVSPSCTASHAHYASLHHEQHAAVRLALQLHCQLVLCPQHFKCSSAASSSFGAPAAPQVRQLLLQPLLLQPAQSMEPGRAHRGCKRALKL